MRKEDFDYLTGLHCSMLSENGTVVSIVGSGPEVTDSTLRIIVEEKSLVHLDLAEARVTDEGLRTLAALPLIDSLRLNSTSITGECLKWLNPDRIKNLYLRKCSNLKDEHLAPISRFKKLERLELGYTNISNAGVALFGDLPYLRLLGTNAIWICPACGLSHQVRRCRSCSGLLKKQNRPDSGKVKSTHSASQCQCRTQRQD